VFPGCAAEPGCLPGLPSLGHANSHITADIYAHVWPCLKRNAIEAMDRALQEEEDDDEADTGKTTPAPATTNRRRASRKPSSPRGRSASIGDGYLSQPLTATVSSACAECTLTLPSRFVNALTNGRLEPRRAR
jgi:hypothetical protein